MGELVPYVASLPAAAEKRFGRELATIEARAALAVTNVRAAQAVEHAHVDRIEGVTRHGMLVVTGLSALEGVLLQQAPLAEARLRTLVDIATVGVAAVAQRAANAQ